ncbi:hybrid sensor histidine kinase/response regulator [Eubacterium sp. MSJ-13]|uniref:ATP-binding response regulator n=1 Tax=Eubacterium sp. MSJ-13 TaxID=2841513 RepID=UPI001C11DDF8|nr:hybrid sensor histidine kinase/response regulator [Eubacterium sp. MSJ-13]MBU5478614.1 hybrid sensor histidine kinase/response regulator [Eubacterium sp. MSJ-13]
MEFTKAFDNMPVGVLVVRRNLEKNNGFEEVYLNDALKNKENLADISDNGILLNLFSDRYDQLKQVINDIFEEKKKTEVISSYNVCLGGYFSTEFYLAGDKDYCICVFREEMEIVGSRNILAAIKDVFYVVSICNMKYDTIYIFEQMRGDEHATSQMINYTQYVSQVTEKIISKEYWEDVVKFMDKDHIRKILSEENRMVSFEYKRYISTEKKLLWSRMSFIWLNNDETGKVKECVMLVKDIHEEKIKEIMENKSLRCAYDVSRVANESKNAFLRHIGHHMKMPVNYIVGVTDMLSASKRYYDDNEVYIKKIKEASNELLENINKIVDVSRIEAGDIEFLFERISINELLKEIIDEIGEYISKRGHVLNINLDNVVHDHVFIDKIRLKQIIKNILLNAVQYTEDYGKIDITVVESKQKFGDIFIYRFIIEDNGPGIDKRIIDNAVKSIPLESGSRSEKLGIGLGLWISKNIIRVLNGELKIESEKGVGTKCTVSVPISTDKNYFQDGYSSIKDNTISEIGQKLKGDVKRILIVQNLITSKNALRQKLICLGFAVESASTGKEALNMYKENGTGYYSAIMTDTQLPEKNGYDLALEIRKYEKKSGGCIPIIAMSKFEGFEDNIYSKGMGITLQIDKDADISVLRAAFDKVNI